MTSRTLIALSLLSLFTASAFAATFSVTTTDDDDDGSCDSTHCSFREAINAANDMADLDVIEFGGLASGAQTITLTTPLPELLQPATIDGGTHPDGMVYLCGDVLPGPEILVFTGGTSTIYSLGIECSSAGRDLTIGTIGAGGGTVTSDPAGIDCGTDCAETYTDGTSVTLTATADPGSVFAGWGGDPDCTDGALTMDADKTCTATFDLVTWDLSVNKNGSGDGTVTSNPAGIDCGADCAETYDDETPVTLTATADAGSVFAGWSGDADCTDGALTMDADKICTATFDLVSWDLSVNKNGSGDGTVTSIPAGIDCGTNCLETYTDGTSVTLTATADPGSVFNGWSGHADCTDGALTMNADKSCTATFDLVGWTLSVGKAGGGDGTITSDPLGIDCGADCAETYPHGTTVTVTPTPEIDSVFVDWTGDADCADGEVTLTGNTACTATFDCVDDLLLGGGMTLSDGEYTGKQSVTAGPGLTIDGTAEPVSFVTGGVITLMDGTSILGELTVSIVANPCQ